MQKNKIFSGKARLTGLALILLSSCYVTDAMAGFEWNPPSEVQVPEPESFPAPMTPMPAAPLKGPISPIPAAPAPVEALQPEPIRMPQPDMPAITAPQLLETAPVDAAPGQVYYEGQPLRRQRPSAPVMPDFGLRRQPPVSPLPSLEPVAPAAGMPGSGYPVIDLHPLEQGGIESPPDLSGLTAFPMEPVEKSGKPVPVIANDVTRPKATRSEKDVPFYSEAIGFGKDIPLALALNQIVPPDYPYAFAEGVDPGVRIDWEGGRPWNAVLSDALEPYGYDAAITGNKVLVYTSDRTQDTKSVEDRMRMPASSASYFQEETTSPVPLSPMTPLPVKEVAPLAMPDVQPVREPGNLFPEEPVTPPATHTFPVKTDPWAVAAINPQAPDPETPAYTSSFSGSPLSVIQGQNGRPEFNPDAESLWSAKAGDTLRDALALWSGQAGIQLHWASRYDYPLQSDVAVQGTFEEAVEILLTGLMEANPRPIGRLHPNYPDGPAVLIVETRRVID
jgi:hypothetical protein